MTDQDRGQQDLDQHDVSVAPAGGQGSKQFAIEDLKQSDRKQDQLLVYLQARIEKREEADQREPDEIHPAKGSMFAIPHIRHDSTGLAPAAAFTYPRIRLATRRRPKLGQHFLTSDAYRRRIVEALALGPDDLVIEIGPGQGAMTGLLAERASQVVAVELDPDLAGKLARQFADALNVEVITADILEVDVGKICRAHGAAAAFVFGNLPYYITSPILHHLLEAPERIRALACVVQLEVAERITAQPGTRDYGYLSVLAQLHSHPRLRFRIPPGAFSPPPAVVSALVTFDMKSGDMLAGRAPVDEARQGDFLAFVKASFAQKRKTLANNLAGKYGADRVHGALRSLGIRENARAEELSVAELSGLFRRLA